MRTTVTDPFTSSFLVHYQQSITLELSRLQETLQTERRSRLETEETDTQYFCSHTVATVLKAMGVLPQSIPSTEYLPYSFSSEVGLPLLRGATFSNEVFVRGTHEDSLCSPVGKSAQDLAAAIQRVLSESGERGEEEAKMGEGEMSGDDGDNVESGKNDHVENEENDHVSNKENDHIDSEKNDHVDDNSPTDMEKVRKAVETVKKDISTLLTPEDLSYLQTQLHLTRALGRASPTTLRSLLQAMTMCLLSSLSSVEASTSPATRSSSPPPAWRSVHCSEEMSTSTTGRRRRVNPWRSVAVPSRFWESPPILPTRSSSHASPQTTLPRWLALRRQTCRLLRLRRQEFTNWSDGDSSGA